MPVKIATKFIVALGCLVYLAQPVLAIGYFPAHAAAIELLWQGHTEKSPEIIAAILSMSEESESVPTKASLRKEILSKFRILSFLGIKVGRTSSRDLAFSNITDFPQLRQGESATAARQWADRKCRDFLTKQSRTLISEWHEYDLIVKSKPGEFPYYAG